MITYVRMYICTYERMNVCIYLYYMKCVCVCVLCMICIICIISKLCLLRVLQAGPMAGKLDRSSKNGLIFCPCSFHSAWQRLLAPELEQISLVWTSPCRSITHVPKSFRAMNAKPANQGVSILASDFWKVASFKGQ